MDTKRRFRAFCVLDFQGGLGLGNHPPAREKRRNTESSAYICSVFRVKLSHRRLVSTLVALHRMVHATCPVFSCGCVASAETMHSENVLLRHTHSGVLATTAVAITTTLFDGDPDINNKSVHIDTAGRRCGSLVCLSYVCMCLVVIFWLVTTGRCS